MSRILHILSQVPSVTGSGIFLDNIAKLAKEVGHQQALVVGIPASRIDLLQPLKALYQTIIPVQFETETLPFIIPGMSDVMPYDSTKFSNLTPSEWTQYNLSFENAIAEAVECFRPDVLLCNHLWAATAAAVSVLATNVSANRPKCFAVCHGTDLRQMQLTPAVSVHVASKCKLLDGVFCLHQRQVHDIRDLYDIPLSKLILSGNGYNSEIFRPQLRSAKSDITLIYAGKLSLSKGVLELIDAVALLNQTTPVKLLLVGKGAGNETDTILERLDEVNQQSKIISSMGFLDQVQLAKAFSNADLFVLPSFYEGLPLVVLEALASGLPVVVNDLPGLKEWLGDDINASGAVHYVPMPALEHVDIIKKTARDAYIQDLTAVLSKAINGLHDQQAPSIPIQAIEGRSWEKVFSTLSAHLFK